MSATDFGDPHQISHVPARELNRSRDAKPIDFNHVSNVAAAERSRDLRLDQSTALLGGVWWFGNKQGVW